MVAPEKLLLNCWKFNRTGGVWDSAGIFQGGQQILGFPKGNKDFKKHPTTT